MKLKVLLDPSDSIFEELEKLGIGLDDNSEYILTKRNMNLNYIPARREEQIFYIPVKEIILFKYVSLLVKKFFCAIIIQEVKEMILWIDVCVRGEHSRTRELAECYLKDREFTTLALAEEDIRPLDKSRLEKRQKLIEKGDFSDEMFGYAKQFAQADEIVIAAPYWDLSFPALLKIYIENICVVGVTFDYLSDGTSKSRCKAKKLTYITTAGGVIPERNFGFDYIKAVAEEFFKIEEFEYIKAEKFDIAGENTKEIMENAKNKIFFGK